MKKRIWLAVAMMVAALALVGCGSTKDSKEKSSGKTYKVGIVQYVDDASLNQIQQSLQDELDARGKKANVTFDYKDYTYNGQADQSTLNQIMADLISKEVDIIIPIATPAAVVAQSALEDSQIPMVFSAVSDPVAAGLVESMDAPGGNITGVSDALNTEAVLKLITSGDAKIKKLGLLYDKSQDSSKNPIKDAKAYCKKNGIAVVEKTGTTNDEISLAADALIAAGVDAVFTPTDNTVMLAELAIYEKFVKAKVPQYCGADSFALNGAFCGYGVNYVELGKETADMVVDILVNGKQAKDMAVKILDNGCVTVNTETADAIGVDYSGFKDLCDKFQTTKTEKEFKK